MHLGNAPILYLNGLEDAPIPSLLILQANPHCLHYVMQNFVGLPSQHLEVLYPHTQLPSVVRAVPQSFASHNVDSEG